MNNTKYLFVFMLLFAFSCKKSTSSNYESKEMAMPAASTDAMKPQAEGGGEGGGATLKKEIDKTQKIIKDGSLEIEVNNIQAYKTSTDTLVKKFGGYYENDVFNANNYQSNYNLTIRIPTTNFETFVANIINEEGGRVTMKDLHARDVTEEYTDVEIRLTNARNYLQRYNELLKKATSIKDILEIQQKIKDVELEIESMTGRLKYMNDRIDYSTLHVSLVEKHEFFEEKMTKKFGDKLVNALKNGYEFLLSTILFMVSIWPVLLIAGLAFYWIKKYRARRKE